MEFLPSLYIYFSRKNYHFRDNVLLEARIHHLSAAKFNTVITKCAQSLFHFKLANTVACIVQKLICYVGILVFRWVVWIADNVTIFTFFREDIYKFHNKWCFSFYWSTVICFKGNYRTPNLTRFKKKDSHVSYIKSGHFTDQRFSKVACMTRKDSGCRDCQRVCVIWRCFMTLYLGNEVLPTHRETKHSRRNIAQK